MRSQSWVGSGPWFAPLAFSGRQFLIVAFTTLEGKRPPYAPRWVHCVVLDAKTGRVLGQRVWSVILNRIAVLPARDGNFLVRQDHCLVLYSPQFRPLARFPLDRRDRDIRGLGYLVEGTPGQRSVVVEKWFDDGTKAELTWLDAATLAPRRRRLFPQSTLGAELVAPVYASSEAVIQLLPPSAVFPGLYASDLDGPLRRVLVDAGPGQPFRNTTAKFVLERVVLVDEAARLLLLVRTDGEVLFSERLSRGEYAEAQSAQTSGDGSRLAVPILKSVGVENEMLHLSIHTVLKRVMIYDLPGMRLVCELNGKDPSLEHVSALALSPDGSELALIRHAAVELYRLPTTGSPPPTALGQEGKVE